MKNPEHLLMVAATERATAMLAAPDKDSSLSASA